MPTVHPEAYQDRPLTDGPGHLTPQHRNRIGAALVGTAPSWLVELHYDENGNANIIILADDLDDSIFPTLIVSTDQTIFRLEELRGGVHRTLCEPRTWRNLLRAVQIRVFWEVQASKTLH